MPDLPRALSIEEGMPHYRPDWRDIGPKLRLFLDGVMVERPVAFNSDEGWVKCYVTDRDGCVLLDPSCDRVQTKVVFGHVEACWREGAHA